MNRPSRPNTAAAAAAAAAARAGRRDHRGLADWIEVFRAGKQTDSRGQACEFTQADLDQMAANVALGAPPAVVGHPEHDAPAYGWAREVRREGDVLLAKFSDLNPGFVEAVDAGAYRNRSVSIFKDPQHGWRIDHIGWLGAARPAVPGLAELAYKAPSTGVQTHQFDCGDDLVTGSALANVSGLFRRLRDWVISTAGLDAADRALPEWDLQNLQDSASQVRDAALAECMAEDSAGEAAGAAAPAMYAAPRTPNPHDPHGGDMTFSQDDLDRVRAETEARVRAETEAALRRQFAADRDATAAELARLQGEQRSQRIQAQIQAWKTSGHVVPADEPGLAEFLAAVEQGQAGQFAFAAAAGEVKQTPAEWFGQFLARRGPLLKLGARLADGAGGDALDAENPQAVGAEAKKYQAEQEAKGRTVTIAQAVTEVLARSGAQAG